MGKMECARRFVFVAVFLCATKVALAPLESHGWRSKKDFLTGLAPSNIGWLTGLAYAEDRAPAREAIRDLAVSDFSLPPELGYVLETRSPARPSAPTVIHIQEAHVNYEGQQHLIGILERLIKDHGLKLILVEGGQGDVGLAYLRSYGPPENRREVAEKYLQAGLISAEEYLDIASESPLILWGVEQQDLYQRNVEAFMETEALRGSLGPSLAAVRQTVEVLTPRVADPALNELEANAKAFEGNRMSLADYAEFLDRLVAREGLTTESYPQLAQFIAIRNLEQSITLEQIPQEHTALIGRLSGVVNQATLEALIEKAQGVKAGSVTPAQFYAELEQLAAAAGLSLTEYPNLSRYIHYLNTKKQLKPTVLSDELEQLLPLLRERLASTPEAKELQAISEELDLTEKLLDFKLSPQEHKRLSALDLSGAISRWERVLNEQRVRHGLEALMFLGLEELANNLPAFLSFYQIAHARDQALVDNVLAKLKAIHEPLAVLITGGFHSPTITQLLRDQGVGLIVMVPKISRATDSRLYHAVLKYKSGHGTFEDVQAAAGSMPAAPVNR